MMTILTDVIILRSTSKKPAAENSICRDSDCLENACNLEISLYVNTNKPVCCDYESAETNVSHEYSDVICIDSESIYVSRRFTSSL